MKNIKSFTSLLLISSVIFLSINFILIHSIFAQSVIPPSLQAGEHWCKMYSNNYDYQTNGSVRYLVQRTTNSNSYCAIMMGDEFLSDLSYTFRGVYCAYTTDNGNTWDSSRVVPLPLKMGFPSAALSGGIPVVTFHGNPGGSAVTSVFKDASWGAMSFSDMLVPQPSPVVEWPHIAANSNGKIVVAATWNVSPGFTLSYNSYNGSSWNSNWTQVPVMSGPSGNCDVVSDYTGNKIAIIGFNYDSSVNYNFVNSTIYKLESTDGGATFSAPTVVFSKIIEGQDTLVHDISAGLQGVYDNAGNLHVAFGVYSTLSENIATNQNYFIKCRTYHWSQATGIVYVAGRTTVPNLADTILQINKTPICHCTIGYGANGNLNIAYTAYLWGNTQLVDNGDRVNAGEILLQSSTNNGQTWSMPVNLTNTPNIEEKHPSLVPNANTTPANDSLKLTFIRDMKAGDYVNNASWGYAPVYLIFRDHPVPTGIYNENTPVKFSLSQNYPNPFNPSTTIEYSIAKNSFVRIKVYDILGREISTLINADLVAGSHMVQFDGRDLPSGIYFYTIRAGDFTETKKMMMVK